MPIDPIQLQQAQLMITPAPTPESPQNVSLGINQDAVNRKYIYPDQVTSYYGIDLKAYTKYGVPIYPWIPMDEWRAKNQSRQQQWGRAAVNTGNELVIGTLKGINDTPKVAKAYFTKGGFAELADASAREDFITSLYEGIQDRNQIYLEKDEHGFVPWKATWWAQGLPSVATTVAMLAPTMGAAKAAGYAAKLLGTVARSEVLINTLQGIGVAEDALFAGKTGTALAATIGGALYGNAYETYLGMAQQLPVLRQQLVDSGKYSSTEIDQILTSEAEKLYRGNLPNAALDMLGIYQLLKPMSGISKLISTNTAKRIGATALAEGIPEGVQEGVNYFMEQRAQANVDRLTGLREESDKYDLDEFFKSGEAWTNMAFGAIGGMLFMGAGNAFNQFAENASDKNAGFFSGVGRAAVTGLTNSEFKRAEAQKLAIAKLKTETDKLLALKSHAELAGDAALYKTVNDRLTTIEAIAHMGFGTFGEYQKHLEQVGTVLNTLYSTEEGKDVKDEAVLSELTDLKHRHAKVVEDTNNAARFYSKGNSFYGLELAPLINYTLKSVDLVNATKQLNTLLSTKAKLFAEDEFGVLRSKRSASLEDLVNARQELEAKLASGTELSGDIERSVKESINSLQERIDNFKASDSDIDAISELAIAEKSLEVAKLKTDVKETIDGTYEKREKAKAKFIKDNPGYGQFVYNDGGLLDALNSEIASSSLADLRYKSANESIARTDTKDINVEQTLEEIAKRRTGLSAESKNKLIEKVDNEINENRNSRDASIAAAYDQDRDYFESIGILKDETGVDEQELLMDPKGASLINAVENAISARDAALRKLRSAITAVPGFVKPKTNKTVIVDSYITAAVNAVVTDIEHALENEEGTNELAGQYLQFLENLKRFVSDPIDFTPSKSLLPKIEKAIKKAKELNDIITARLQEQDKLQATKYKAFVNTLVEAVAAALPGFSGKTIADVYEAIAAIKKDSVKEAELRTAIKQSLASKAKELKELVKQIPTALSPGSTKITDADALATSPMSVLFSLAELAGFTTPAFKVSLDSKDLSPNNEVDKSIIKLITSAIPQSKLLELLDSDISLKASVEALDKNIKKTPALFPEQRSAVLAFLNAYGAGRGMFYLQGVAGAGKTTVALASFLQALITIGAIKENQIFAMAKGGAVNSKVNKFVNGKESNIEWFANLVLDANKLKAELAGKNLLVVDEIGKLLGTEYDQLMTLVEEINKTRSADDKLRVLMTGDPNQIAGFDTIPVIDGSNTHSLTSRASETTILPALTISQRTNNARLLSFQNRFISIGYGNVFAQPFTESHNADHSQGVAISTSSEEFINRLKDKVSSGADVALIVETKDQADFYKTKIPNVNVFTVSASQGLDFDEVFVHLLTYSNLGEGFTNSNGFERDNKAHYTAISRAKNYVNLLHSSTNGIKELTLGDDINAQELKAKKFADNAEEYKQFLTNELKSLGVTKEEVKKEAVKETAEEQDTLEKAGIDNRPASGNPITTTVSDNKPENKEVKAKSKSAPTTNASKVNPHYAGVKHVNIGDPVVTMRRESLVPGVDEIVYLLKLEDGEYIEVGNKQVPKNGTKTAPFSHLYSAQVIDTYRSLGIEFGSATVSNAGAMSFSYTDVPSPIDGKLLDRIKETFAKFFSSENFVFEPSSMSTHVFVATDSNIAKENDHLETSKLTLRIGSPTSINTSFKVNPGATYMRVEGTGTHAVTGKTSTRVQYIPLEPKKLTSKSPDLQSLISFKENIKKLETLLQSVYPYKYGTNEVINSTINGKQIPVTSGKLFLDLTKFFIDGVGNIGTYSQIEEVKKAFETINSLPNKAEVIKAIEAVHNDLYTVIRTEKIKTDNPKLVDENINEFVSLLGTGVDILNLEGSSLSPEVIEAAKAAGYVLVSRSSSNEAPVELRKTFEIVGNNDGKPIIYHVKVSVPVTDLDGGLVFEQNTVPKIEIFEQDFLAYKEWADNKGDDTLKAKAVKRIRKYYYGDRPDYSNRVYSSEKSEMITSGLVGSGTFEASIENIVLDFLTNGFIQREAGPAQKAFNRIALNNNKIYLDANSGQFYNLQRGHRYSNHNGQLVNSVTGLSLTDTNIHADGLNNTYVIREVASEDGTPVKKVYVKRNGSFEEGRHGDQFELMDMLERLTALDDKGVSSINSGFGLRETTFDRQVELINKQDNTLTKAQKQAKQEAKDKYESYFESVNETFVEFSDEKAEATETKEEPVAETTSNLQNEIAYIERRRQEAKRNPVPEPVSYKEAVEEYKSTDLGSNKDAERKKQRVVDEAQTKEGRAFVENQVAQMETNEDGTITVYRSGTMQEGHNPATTDKKTAEVIASERKKQGLSSDIIEVRVQPTDISAVIPGIESEVFININASNKNRISDSTKKPQKTKNQIIKEKESVKIELDEVKQKLLKLNEDFKNGKFPFSEKVYNETKARQEQKIKNLEWQLTKYDAELTALNNQPTSQQNQSIEAKKADIEKLEKEKQEALQPLIEEKEQIEKEIEEIEKNDNGSVKQEVETIDDFLKNNNITEQQLKDEENKLKNHLDELGLKLDTEYNFEDIINRIIKNVKGRFLKTVLKGINSLVGNKLKTKFVFSSVRHEDAAGQYFSHDDTIKIYIPNLSLRVFTLNKRGKEYQQETNIVEVFNKVFIHELIHAFTILKIRATETNAKLGLATIMNPSIEKERLNISRSDQKTIDSLNKIFDFLKNNELLKGEYGVSDIVELVTEALSNEGFAEKLKSIELPKELRYKTDNNNVFENIILYISKLVEDLLNLGSAYSDDNALDSIAAIINDFGISYSESDQQSFMKINKAEEKAREYFKYGKSNQSDNLGSETTKLQQLKQKLAEVNKKIDAITKRFDSQIAQKQSELKALEEQSTSAKKADIKKKIIISGTDGGFTIIDASNIKNENAGTTIDVRRSSSDEKYEIEYGIGDDKKSLFSDIHYGKKDSYHFFITDKKTGKRFYIVGISSRKIGVDADRNGSLFASIEDTGNIDNITRSLLELELIKQFEIQSKKRKDVFSPLPNDFINKVNAKYDAELAKLTGKTVNNTTYEVELESVKALLASGDSLAATTKLMEMMGKYTSTAQSIELGKLWTDLTKDESALDEEDDEAGVKLDIDEGIPTDNPLSTDEAMKVAKSLIPDITTDELLAMSGAIRVGSRTISKALGYFERGVIYLLTGDNGTVDEQVVRHEVFHKIFRQYVPISTRQAVINAVKKTKAFETYMANKGLRAEDATWVMAEEFLALTFQKYNLGRVKASGFTAKLFNVLRRILNGIQRLLGRDEAIVEKLFQDITDLKYKTKLVPNTESTSAALRKIDEFFPEESLERSLRTYTEAVALVKSLLNKYKGEEANNTAITYDPSTNTYSNFRTEGVETMHLVTADIRNQLNAKLISLGYSASQILSLWSLPNSKLKLELGKIREASAETALLLQLKKPDTIKSLILELEGESVETYLESVAEELQLNEKTQTDEVDSLNESVSKGGLHDEITSSLHIDNALTLTKQLKREMTLVKTSTGQYLTFRYVYARLLSYFINELDVRGADIKADIIKLQSAAKTDPRSKAVLDFLLNIYNKSHAELFEYTPGKTVEFLKGFEYNNNKFSYHGILIPREKYSSAQEFYEAVRQEILTVAKTDASLRGYLAKMGALDHQLRFYNMLKAIEVKGYNADLYRQLAHRMGSQVQNDPVVDVVEVHNREYFDTQQGQSVKVNETYVKTAKISPNGVEVNTKQALLSGIEDFLVKNRNKDLAALLTIIFNSGISETLTAFGLPTFVTTNIKSTDTTKLSDALKGLKRALPTTTSGVDKFIDNSKDAIEGYLNTISKTLSKSDDFLAALSYIDSRNNNRYIFTTGSWMYDVLSGMLTRTGKQLRLPKFISTKNYISNNNIFSKNNKLGKLQDILDVVSLDGMVKSWNGVQDEYPATKYQGFTPADFFQHRFIHGFLASAGLSEKTPAYFQYTYIQSDRKSDVAAKIKVLNFKELGLAYKSMQNFELERDELVKSKNVRIANFNKARPQWANVEWSEFLEEMKTSAIEDFLLMMDEFVSQNKLYTLQPNNLPALTKVVRTLESLDVVPKDIQRQLALRLGDTVNKYTTDFTSAEDIRQLFYAFYGFYLQNYLNSEHLNQLVFGDKAFTKHTVDLTKRMQGTQSPGDAQLIDPVIGNREKSRMVVAKDFVKNVGLQEDVKKVFQKLYRADINSTDAVTLVTPFTMSQLRKGTGNYHLQGHVKPVAFGIDSNGVTHYIKTAAFELTDELVSSFPELKRLRKEMESYGLSPSELERYNELLEKILAGEASTSEEFEYQELIKNSIEYYVFESAYKVGRPLDLIENGESIQDKHVIEFDNSLMRIQGDPLSSSTDISNTTQFNYFANTNGLNEAETFMLYKIDAELMRTQFERYNNSGEIIDEEGNIRQDKVKAMIKKALAKSAQDERMWDMLHNKVDVNFPSIVKRAVISIANKHSKNSVEIRHSGKKLVAQSALGITMYQMGNSPVTYNELTNVQKQKANRFQMLPYNLQQALIQVADVLSSEDLLIDDSRVSSKAYTDENFVKYLTLKHKLTSEQTELFNGYVEQLRSGDKTLDILVPRRLKMRDANNFTEVIVPQWWYKSLPKELQDSIKSNKNLLLKLTTGMAVRIPTTGIHSSIPLKIIVATDPAINRIIAPEELVALHGSDFDVDSLFVMHREFVTSEDLPADKDYIKIGDFKLKKGYLVGYDSTGELSLQFYNALLNAIEHAKDKTIKGKLLNIKAKFLLNSKVDNNLNIITADRNQRDMNTPISFEPFKLDPFAGITYSDFLEWKIKTGKANLDEFIKAVMETNKASLPESINTILDANTIKLDEKAFKSGDLILPNKLKEALLASDIGVEAKMKILFGKQDLKQNRDVNRLGDAMRFHQDNHGGKMGVGIQANSMKVMAYLMYGGKFTFNGKSMLMSRVTGMVENKDGSFTITYLNSNGEVIEETGKLSRPDVKIRKVLPTVEDGEVLYDYQDLEFSYKPLSSDKAIKYDSLTRLTRSKGHHVFELLDTLINGYIDNVKEQVTSVINANSMTIDSISLMIGLGFEFDSAAFIMNQPIIKEVTKSRITYNSKISNLLKTDLDNTGKLYASLKRLAPDKALIFKREMSVREFNPEFGDAELVEVLSKYKDMSLDAVLDSPELTAKDVIAQVSALLFFQELKSISSDFFDVNRILKLLQSMPVEIEEMRKTQLAIDKIKEGRLSFESDNLLQIPHIAEAIAQFESMYNTVTSTIHLARPEVQQMLTKVKDNTGFSLKTVDSTANTIDTVQALTDQLQGFLLSSVIEEAKTNGLFDSINNFVGIDTVTGELVESIADGAKTSYKVKVRRKEGEKWVVKEETREKVQINTDVKSEELWMQKFLLKLQEFKQDVNNPINNNRFFSSFVVSRNKNKAGFLQMRYIKSSGTDVTLDAVMRHGFITLDPQLQQEFTIYAILQDRGRFGFDKFTNYIPTNTSASVTSIDNVNIINDLYVDNILERLLVPKDNQLDEEIRKSRLDNLLEYFEYELLRTGGHMIRSAISARSKGKRYLDKNQTQELLSSSDITPNMLKSLGYTESSPDGFEIVKGGNERRWITKRNKVNSNAVIYLHIGTIATDKIPYHFYKRVGEQTDSKFFIYNSQWEENKFTDYLKSLDVFATLSPESKEVLVQTGRLEKSSVLKLPYEKVSSYNVPLTVQIAGRPVQVYRTLLYEPAGAEDVEITRKEGQGKDKISVTKTVNYTVYNLKTIYTLNPIEINSEDIEDNSSEIPICTK